MTNNLIPLSGPVGPGQRNKPDDVFLIRAALATLKPTPGQRTFYDDRVDRHYTPKVAVATRAFQKSRKRPETGIIQPKDETLNLLTAGIKKYREELKRAPQASLIFDGQALHWVGRPFNGKKWPAVSGSRGFQTWEFQKMMNKGPIPEGTYHVRQLNLRNIDNLSLVEWIYYNTIVQIVGVAASTHGARIVSGCVQFWAHAPTAAAVSRFMAAPFRGPLAASI